MLVGVAHKKGRSEKTFIFNSNTCHPHMASDGFASTAVLIRLFQWLSQMDTYYSYKLILAPEHYGSIFYLRDRSREEVKSFVGGLFAEMLGNEGPFVVAETFDGDSVIDRVFRYAAKNYAVAPRFVGFREAAGNDETVWEAPGYEVPFVQVARSNDRNMHYREYHTNYDNPQLMRHALLQESFDVFQRAVKILENNYVLRRKFNGLVSLSNPQYNLYVSRVDPAVWGEDRLARSASWGHLQDCIPRYFNGKTTVLDIAEKHDLDFFDLLQYLESFKAKNLISFEVKELERSVVEWVN
jgi:aminopeptidase-like protein